MNMKSLSSLVTLTLAFALMAGFAPTRGSAQDCGEKFKRGLAGTIFCLLELPGCVVDTAEKEGTAKAYTWGVVKGFGRVPLRAVVGMYEMCTFFVPAPRDYKPILTPETPFNYFYPDWGPQNPVIGAPVPTEPVQVSPTGAPVATPVPSNR